MPNIFDVAHYILQTDTRLRASGLRGRGDRRSRLQALCYFAQAQHLAVTGGIALFPEDFTANGGQPFCLELCKNYSKIQEKQTGTLTPEQKDIIGMLVARFEKFGSLHLVHRIIQSEPWVTHYEAQVAARFAEIQTNTTIIITKDSLYRHTKPYTPIQGINYPA